mmetsp:Transcript_19065/g.39004  ORF Transcript_19065/g.39004 Transcript_19065/m.39004 type:complete len:109 (+) Transcript_19065:496-822(+)
MISNKPGCHGDIPDDDDDTDEEDNFDRATASMTLMEDDDAVSAAIKLDDEPIISSIDAAFTTVPKTDMASNNVTPRDANAMVCIDRWSFFCVFPFESIVLEPDVVAEG